MILDTLSVDVQINSTDGKKGHQHILIWIANKTSTHTVAVLCSTVGTRGAVKGERGVAYILAEQLTQIMPTTLLLTPRIFRHSYGPGFVYRCCCHPHHIIYLAMCALL